MNRTRERIARLVGEYLELAESPRNTALMQDTWQQPGLAYGGDIGVPRPGVVPILAVPHLSMWARKMGRSVCDVFTNPETYLAVFLSREIGRFMQIKDDRPLLKEVFTALGAGFESTLFGARQHYSDTEDPWVDRTPVLQRLEDDGKLQRFDFKNTGLMSLAHRFHQEMSGLLDGTGLTVAFPEWVRSAFGLAVQLRGLPFSTSVRGRTWGGAAAAYGDVATLDVCLSAMEIYRADEPAMRARITRIIETCRRHHTGSFSIRPGILEAFQSVEEDLAAVTRWVEVARDTVERLCLKGEMPCEKKSV